MAINRKSKVSKVMRLIKSALLWVLCLLVAVSCGKKGEPQYDPLQPSGLSHIVLISLVDEQGNNLLTTSALQSLHFVGGLSKKDLRTELSSSQSSLSVYADLPSASEKKPYPQDGDLLTSSFFTVQGAVNALEVRCVYLYTSQGQPDLFGGDAVRIVRLVCDGQTIEANEQHQIVLPLQLSEGKLSVRR